MEENKDYHAYRYGDHLTPGSELKIEHSVVCENVDISTLITMGIDSLENIPSGFIPARPTMPLERTTAPSTGLIMTPFTAMCCGKSGNVPELP